MAKYRERERDRTGDGGMWQGLEGGMDGWGWGVPQKTEEWGRRQEMNEVDSKMGGLRKGPREG